jgi:hypothetical protein
MAALKVDMHSTGERGMGNRSIRDRSVGDTGIGRLAPSEQEIGSGGELLLVTAFSLLLSLVAFTWFYRHGDTLLYGDAVAHLNIARRLTDARNPGWDQIGSVWLPLPHLLVAPFVANNWLWRTGIGGSIPSMLAYVLGVVGIYRLLRARTSAASAILAAAICAFNPSMLYMQSTAMTESIFLAAVIWSVVYFDDFRRGLATPSATHAAAPGALPAWRAIERCGCCLAAAIFTRYDGWILAFAVGLCATFSAIWWYSTKRPSELEIGRVVRSMTAFLLLMALCPTLWLAHNYKNSGHPMDWMNGPYSAKAIALRTSRPTDAPYPGKDHMGVAVQYFLKAARMNTGEGSREKWLIVLAAAAAAVSILDWRRCAAYLLLWIPLPFYAYSIAYGSVPIFVPEWWPFSYYNVRYGLELLPAIAVFVALIPWFVSQSVEWLFAHGFFARASNAAPRGAVGPPSTVSPVATSFAEGLRVWIALAATLTLLVVTLLAFSSSAWCFSRRSRDRNSGRRFMIPICYREAFANSRGRVQLETQIADALAWIPPDATILMSVSDYPGAIQRAGIPFAHVINESTFIAWDAARSAPAAAADYVVAIGGDSVAEAVRMNPRGLTKLAILHTSGKPDVSIYVSDTHRR